jgi:cardiolipin synthase
MAFLLRFPLTFPGSLAAIRKQFNMKPGRLVATFFGTALSLFILCVGAPEAAAAPASAKQKALDEWRSLTAPSTQAPRVFAKGDHIRFYFVTQSAVEEFSAEWHHVRVPTYGYKVNSAVLRWNQKLSRVPDGERGWREAAVISGAEWRRLATNLIATLTPQTPMHAAYYQAFLADGVLYRDAQGAPRFAALGEQPADVIIEHRFSIEETLDILARKIEEHLERSHPGGSLFLMMAPDAHRFTQPLLLDRQQRRCVFLAPAALYDSTDRGLGLTATAQGLSAMTIEAHGLALIKNPVSSAARLGDLGIQTLLRFLRLPLPKPGETLAPLSHSEGMDLVQWEAWLDHYTGTLREEGSIDPLIDGDRFFSRLQQAFAQATNHIRCNVYIFDRDDVAVGIADQLKQRSDEVEVQVLLDRLGSIGAGVNPPATPMAEDFTPPASISSYLKDKSHVRVRAGLNPWFSADHSKVFLVDGNSAWLGGMNLGREYRYEWHDMMVELKGPVVASLEDQFRRDWAHAGPLGDLSYFAAVLSGPSETHRAPDSTNWIQLRRLPTRTGWKPFSAAVLGSLRRARSYAYIENPYLFEKHVISALVRARHRGVDVRVVLPRINDFKPGSRGNLVIANYLLEQGVRVYFYPGMTHVKAMMVDGWSCVGSANLNHLSLHINQEQNIATSDPAFAARLKHDLFEEDFARSYELTDPIAVDWVDFLVDQMLENF